MQGGANTEIDIEVDPELVPVMEPQYLDERLLALSQKWNGYALHPHCTLHLDPCREPLNFSVLLTKDVACEMRSSHVLCFSWRPCQPRHC